MDAERHRLCEQVLGQLLDFRRHMQAVEQGHEALIRALPPDKQGSARNLLHYLGLRSLELRQAQDQLHELGLSSLASSEQHTLDQVEKVIALLEHILGRESAPPGPSPAPLSYAEGRSLLDAHTEALLGPKPADGRARIMVTLPTEAAEDKKLVEALIRHGMNIARINCAHDEPATWERMIRLVRRTAERLEQPCLIYMDLAGPKIRTEQVYPGKKKKGLKLRPGDRLRVVRGLSHPVRPHRDEEERLIAPAWIGLTLQEAFQHVAPGHRVFFDDGKFGSQVRQVFPEGFEVEIFQAPLRKARLRDDKGVNLPDTPLDTPSLTPEDEAVLAFACHHADILGYSFVRNAEDVRYLHQKLAQMERQPGIVLKIERAEAVQQLPGLLLAGMEQPRLGVMIARGDLAVEIGFERLSEVQAEILWLCEAAHVPVIWATQVLEHLAKEGLATRSEISDAADAARAECVMLNKGPYIVEAVKTLRDILRRMQQHLSKKRYTLRPLSIAQQFIGEEKG
jgi:pyruvate kinase